MISYAQNFENAVLARVFEGRDKGFYIDLGAGDPNFYSVTKHFYDLGWSGVNVEPLEEKFSLLQQQRTRDVNLKCAIDEHEGTRVLNSLSFAELSSFDEQVLELAKEHGFGVRLESVKTLPLWDVCERYAAGQSIQFMKIDVEGWERIAIASGDWQKFRPEVVVVEAAQVLSLQPNHQLWKHLLLENDYLFAYSDGLNRFYVASEHRNLQSRLNGPTDFLVRGVRLAREVELESKVMEHDASRRALDAQLHAETAAREKLMDQVRAEVEARETLMAQVRAEVEAREMLMAQVRAEVEARGNANDPSTS